MKNTEKNLSNLLIAGSVSAIISAAIGFFRSLTATTSGNTNLLQLLSDNSNPQPLTISDVFYYIMVLSVAVAGIVFANRYRKGSTTDFQLPGILFLVAAAADLWFFFRNNSFSSFKHFAYILLPVLSGLASIGSKVVFAWFLMDKRADKTKLNWAMLVYGGLILTAGGIVNNLYSLVDMSLGFSLVMKIQNYVNLFVILSPIAYILISLKMMKLSEPVTDEDTIPAYRKESNSDLLDDDSGPNDLPAIETRKDPYTVFWWLATFLLSAIPLIGTGILVYWSVSRSDLRRANWAVATIFISLLTSLFLQFRLREELQQVLSFPGFLVLLAGTVLFYAVLLTICVVINNRNQRNVQANTFSFSVIKWIGYSLLAILPVVNLICLIIFSVDKKNVYRRKWAMATLLLFAFQIFAFGGWDILLYKMTGMF